MITQDLRKQKVLEYLKSYHLASLATSSKQNEPHAAIMGYLVDDDFTFYFISINNSRKLEDLRDNPQAGIAIGSTSKPTIIQGGGKAEVLPYVKPELFESIFSNSPNQDISKWPIAKLGSEGYSTIIVKPTWLVWLNLDEQENNDVYGEHYFKII